MQEVTYNSAPMYALSSDSEEDADKHENPKLVLSTPLGLYESLEDDGYTDKATPSGYATVGIAGDGGMNDLSYSNVLGRAVYGYEDVAGDEDGHDHDEGGSSNQEGKKTQQPSHVRDWHGEYAQRVSAAQEASHRGNGVSSALLSELYLEVVALGNSYLYLFVLLLRVVVLFVFVCF
jgi:hypothetical protein